MTNQSEHRGSCLCGAVRLSAKISDNSVAACHCSICRKWGGGPLLAVDCGTDVQLEGGDDVSVYGSSAWAERGSCRKCGTHLFYRLKQGTRYFVPVGLFDDGEQWRFDHQIFIEEKPPFYAYANETKNMTGAEVFAQFAPPG